MTTDSVEARLRDIEARRAALPDFMGLPKSQGVGGWLLSHDGSKTYAETHTAEMHEYTAHAYGDLAWLMALVRRYRAALETIGPEEIPTFMPGDSDCMHCGAYAESIDLEDHSESCPWRIAREALNEEVPP